MRIARLHRLLALFLVLCMLCSASLPVYAEALPMPSDESTASTETPAADTENFSTTETATSTETNTDNSDVSEPVSESGLSEAAQAFVDAVAALDRDAIVSASNAWGLASKAWQADQSNAELESALNDAIAAQDAACAPLYNAEELYNALTADEQGLEAVTAAYSRFEEIWTAMVSAMENPVDNSETTDEPPELTDIVDVMYPGLPVAPTGYYLDSNGLPVVTGDTMISIEGWGTEDYSAYDANKTNTQVALDGKLLESEGATASFPRMDGEDYAIVPISIQILYPANGSCADISLPENVTLLGYSFTSDNLMEATEDERSTMLHYDFSEISASVAGIYVMADSNFEATLTYTDDSKTLTKKLSVTIDDSAPQSGILQDRFSQESATSTYALNAAPRAGLQVTQCVNTSVGWMNYLGGMPVLCADHGKWAWGPGATYANKYPPVASYSAAGSVWVDASAFGKGWEADQATIWSVGFNNGTPAGARSSTYSLESDTGDTSYYDRLSWQANTYPDSVAASIVDDLNKAVPYLGPGESQTVYLGTIYTPSNSAWQRFVFLDYTPVVLGGDTEIPGLTPEGKPIEIPWEASYERTATLDLEYTVQIDKSANITHEKLDDAIFTITANQTGGSISGGTWSIDEPQKVVTTVDGAASATWVVHYEVTKSASQSGSITANSEQDAITNGQAQANQQQAAAQAACEAQVNSEIDAALAAAKEQLSQITFSYEETTVPHGFDPTDSSSGSVSVPSNGSATAVVANQPWQANVTWEKRDALTGGRITEDAEYAFYEWNVDTNKYEISSNYRVTRLENGLYTVTVTNPVYTDWTEGYVYYTQDNLGKFRIEEVTAPAGYTDAALQGTDWVEHWSQEFEITDSDQTYSYTGDDADYNRPQGNKVIIKKIEAHTGEIIVDDAVFTLYQWNQERGLYEKSKDYAFVRDAEGLYTITCLHDDWSQYEEGNLYYEDTLCDVREDTVNSDGTTTEHAQYYTDYEPVNFPIENRSVTNDGQFVVVETKSPYGYYGDWTGDEDRTNFEPEDAGKRAYYIRLTGDGSTITLGNQNYNANVLTENQGGTLIDLGDNVVSLEVFGDATAEYPEDALYKNNPWYSALTWEKRDALTGGRITEDAEYEIQEWNPEKGEYEKSTHYRVVRLDSGLYTVNLIEGAFFPGWVGKQQGYVYYHQANEGKYRIVELTAPAGYTDAALIDGKFVEQWSREFEINDGHLTFSYTNENSDYNQPKGNRLIIKKIEAHTGEIIVDDAVFTLYQWNQERGLYEKSKDYAFVRDAEGLYTITCLHDDWSQYEEGNLYYEDTLCDVREDTVNSDGTTTEHPQYYTDYEPVDFSIDERAVTNDGQFVVVESKSPYGYYGDWTGSRETPNFEVEDAGKHAYYIRLTDDGSTITLTDSEYNAHVLTENKGGTLIELGDGSVVTLDVFSPALEEYDENNLFRNNPWYSTVVWEKRDALTGGLVDADTTFEIQEWNPVKGEYERSTHYQVVRREDGKYTVHLIGDAFFEGWEGKQGVLYYHQANQGKYRIVELKAPASYNLKAWEHNNWVIGWSEEIVVHPDYPTYEFLGETASCNMPYKTKVLIKKVDDATGEFILPDTTWTLYEWNERNNQYEVSTNYKIVRREDGYYTVTTLHSDWTHYEEGYLYFEDTQTDYPDSGRWFSNEGKFLIVESQAPAGYYGDYWRNDEPGTHSTDNGSDLGKRGYAFTLTEDNGTLWLTNADYNAKILYNLDEGNATVVLADGRPTSVIINEKQQPSYERDETSFGNTAKYGYVVFDRSQYNKKWAQTGDDDTYTTSYEATTSKLGDKIAAPEDTLWKNGKLFELEDYVTDLISGPVYYDVTLENIKSLDEVPSTMEYQLSAEKTITLALVSADWLEEPRSSYTGFVDLGYSPKQPTANETETITADDGHTFTGHLVGIEQTGDYGWVDMEIPATYYGWPDVKGIFLGSLVLPHNDNKPVYEGYETEILTYLGFNNKDYKIVDAEWTGNWEALPGSDMMNRSATFTISVYATGWIARYEEGEEGERTGTVTASYSFEDTASQEDGLYHWLVTAHYKPASVWTVLQAAAAVLGIGLVIAAVVLILFILSRKRKEKKRTTEKV